MPTGNRLRLDPISAGTPIPAFAGRRVLLVEDAPGERRLLAALLAKAGAEVVLECDARVAVERVYPTRGSAAAFDAVVMDLVMWPDDGADAAAGLRSRGYAGPVVIVTGPDEPGPESHCSEAGCDLCLRRPVPPEALVNTLGTMLSAHRTCGSRALTGS